MQNEPKPTNQEKENKLDPTARHNARRYALQALYQWQIADTPLDVIEAEFKHYHIDKKIDFDYFKELLHNIPRLLPTLDQEMQPYLGRILQEIDAIELTVLRLATYELI